MSVPRDPEKEQRAAKNTTKLAVLCIGWLIAWVLLVHAIGWL